MENVDDLANPVICSLTRGVHTELEHLGSWALVDNVGNVIDSRGNPDQPVFARSSTKPIQALPLVESGCADQLGLSPAELAIAMSSHDAEDEHIRQVKSLLAKAGLTESDLSCGPTARGSQPGSQRLPIHSDCSGKHAGFLATAKHLGDDAAKYLDPDSTIQMAIVDAMKQMTDLADYELRRAIDGCSAPTFRLPLKSLGTAIARWSNPSGLSAERAKVCQQLADAMASHPQLIGGSDKAFDTGIIGATDGKLLAKRGALGILVVGVRGEGVSLVVKIQDGTKTALYSPTLLILQRLGLLSAAELEALSQYNTTQRTNAGGLVVGQISVPEEVLPEKTFK